jgi:hypothetical protein
MRKIARTDENQAAIVAELRKAGATVQSLHQLGGGVPDILVGIDGKNYLLEIKTRTGRMTPDESEWHRAWRGDVCVVRTPDEALIVTGLWGRRCGVDAD